MTDKVVQKQRNPKALATASRISTAKSNKINALGIHPKMTKKAFGIMVLEQAKIKQDGGDTRSWNDIVKGQEWYLDDLRDYSKLNGQQRAEFEYIDAEHDSNSFDEIVANLDKLIAA